MAPTVVGTVESLIRHGPGQDRARVEETERGGPARRGDSWRASARARAACHHHPEPTRIRSKIERGGDSKFHEEGKGREGGGTEGGRRRVRQGTLPDDCALWRS